MAGLKGNNPLCFNVFFSPSLSGTSDLISQFGASSPVTVEV